MTSERIQYTAKLRVAYEDVSSDRRYVRNSFMAIGIAVTIIAAVTLAMSGIAEAQPSRQNVPSSNGSFGPIKQIDAGLLNIGYVEAGPTDGTPVILLHGWPYDITAMSTLLLC